MVITGCVELTPDTGSQVMPAPVSTSMPSPLPTATIIEELEKNITNSIGMEFVLIPAGEFEMGSPSSEKYRVFNEGPVHNVKLGYDFYLGKYEVTQKQWREIQGNSPSFFKGDDLPVEQVSWYDIQEFIKKLNEKEGTDKYRLPSEAEWEYAARAGTTSAYSFGDNVSELRNYAWYRKTSNGSTHPVGQKNPNPWGLYDTNGNVWEFTEDSWHDTYNGAPTDGSPWESKDAQLRVSRGGAWRPDAEELRSAMRLNEAPYGRYPGLGFRLAKSVITPPKNTSASLGTSLKKQDVLSMRFNLQNYTALHLWQPPLPSTMSIVVGPNGTIYVLKRDNTVSTVDPVSGVVAQMTEFDAATQEIMHRFASNEATNELTERVASPDGMLYFTDWSKGIIVREEENGAKKIVVEGLTKNSPIQFDFGPDGMLYFLSECNFRRVNATGGLVKSFDFIQQLNSELLCPIDFAFEPSGDVLFISPTSSNIIRATLHEEKLDVVVPGTLNSPAIAVSPEDRIFIGQTAQFPIEPSRIVRLEDDGKTSAIADVPGLLSAIAFGPDGTLYGISNDVSPDYNEFWLYRVLNNGSLQMIMHRKSTLNQQIYKLHTLSVDPVSGDIIGFDDLKKRVVRFSSDGKQESVIGPVMPYPVWSGRAVVDSEGAVWLLPIAESGRLNGPTANRELYRILPGGETKLIAKFPYLRGCCAPDTMTIGPDNAAYLILSPEFELRSVSREGRIDELAKNLPINPLGIAVNKTGSIIFSSSEGIFVFKPKV